MKAVGVVHAAGAALQLGLAMLWEVLWPLALGFLISAAVQTLVRRRTLTAALGQDSLRSLALATALGAASSSCSYAAVAVARTLFRKGASFTNAIVFEFASTNLVFELSLALLALLGWPFLAAEFAGGLLMIVLVAALFRLTLRPALVAAARGQAGRGLAGRMEGHGAMDMSVIEGPLLRRLLAGRTWTAISHYFFMDVASLWTDLGLGFLIAGALAAWVPQGFWRGLFLAHQPALALVWGPLIGPLISMVSFVCSVGNVPLAAVLWNGGISFGGVISFIFADLIILPIVNIHRRYYGWKAARYVLAVSYVAMAGAGVAVDLLLRVTGLLPAHRRGQVPVAGIGWNLTTWLNLAFLLLMAVLAGRFLRTGGPAMLRAMSAPQHGGKAARDPVCGMMVDPSRTAEHVSHGGTTYHFCSADCRAAFEKDPQRYASHAQDPHASHPPHDGAGRSD